MSILIKKSKLFTILIALLLSLLCSPVYAQTPTKLEASIPENKPILSFKEIPSTTSIGSAGSCIKQPFLDRYYEGDVKKYEAEAGVQNKCMQNYAEATIVSSKINDLRSSITVIDDRIVQLEKTAAFLKKLPAKFSIYLVGIPSGLVAMNPHVTATNLTRSCLIDNANNPDSNRQNFVGNRAIANGQFFDQVPASQIKLINDTKKKMTDIQNEIEKSKGKMSTGQLIGLAKAAHSLASILSEQLIPIMDLSSLKSESIKSIYDRGDYLAVSADETGESRVSIPTFIKPLTFVMGVSGDLTPSTLSIGQAKFSPVLLPAQKMVKDIINATDKHLKRYKQIRAQFLNAADFTQKKYDDMQKNNFNCSK